MGDSGVALRAKLRGLSKECLGNMLILREIYQEESKERSHSVGEEERGERWKAITRQSELFSGRKRKNRVMGKPHRTVRRLGN